MPCPTCNYTVDENTDFFFRGSWFYVKRCACEQVYCHACVWKLRQSGSIDNSFYDGHCPTCNRPPSEASNIGEAS